MGSIGAPEILVILVLALLVLGPERLPQAARTAGKWMAELRRITSSLQAEVQPFVDQVMTPINNTAAAAGEAYTATTATVAADNGQGGTSATALGDEEGSGSVVELTVDELKFNEPAPTVEERPPFDPSLN